MKESYRKGLAGHPGPESCVGRRKAAGEALTGVHTDQVLSCEIRQSGMPTPLTEAEGYTDGGVKCKSLSGPTQSETLRMCGNSVRENRETPETPAADRGTGRLEKAINHTSSTNVSGESDGRIVPTKPPNKGRRIGPAEAGEGRRPTKGNAQQTTTLRTQSREGVSTGLLRVREVARRDKRAQFTALLHHVSADLLRESYYALKRQAAPGVDGLTWHQYEDGLEEHLCSLHERVHQGTYRALPSKRSYIPKADGRMRPLGVAALEDKIVQAAVVQVLNTIYEEDFLGFSYGFRPGRGQHDGLDALWVGLMGKKVNWVLDADIQGFFDTISHEWLLRFLEHRVADRRILRLIRKWLRVGVSEDGQWAKTEVGTPQGSVISPLLANVYLHYVLDLWVQQWRTRHPEGDVIIVRYADDFVMGFQHRGQAEQFLLELQERMQRFGLTLHPDKTRLIEFGRFAAENRKRRGQDKPQTFDFLGLTHMCGRKKETGGFIVKRKTSTKRLRAAIQKVKAVLLRDRHHPVAQQGYGLGQVVRGYFNYHAIPGNAAALETFRREVVRAWLHALRRRSQRSRLTWRRFVRLVDLWIPRPKILHPYPNVRFFAMHPR
jgi:RNA-directed DNA polymerase